MLKLAQLSKILSSVVVSKDKFPVLSHKTSAKYSSVAMILRHPESIDDLENQKIDEIEKTRLEL